MCPPVGATLRRIDENPVSSDVPWGKGSWDKDSVLILIESDRVPGREKRRSGSTTLQLVTPHSLEILGPG